MERTKLPTLLVDDLVAEATSPPHTHSPYRPIQIIRTSNFEDPQTPLRSYQALPIFKLRSPLSPPIPACASRDPFCESKLEDKVKRSCSTFESSVKRSKERSKDYNRVLVDLPPDKTIFRESGSKQFSDHISTVRKSGSTALVSSSSNYLQNFVEISPAQTPLDLEELESAPALRMCLNISPHVTQPIQLHRNEAKFYKQPRYHDWSTHLKSKKRNIELIESPPTASMCLFKPSGDELKCFVPEGERIFPLFLNGETKAKENVESSFMTRQMREWDTMEVAFFLDEIGMSQYHQIFHNSQVDGKLLYQLDEAILESFGVHRTLHINFILLQRDNYLRTSKHFDSQHESLAKVKLWQSENEEFLFSSSLEYHSTSSSSS